MDSRYVIALLCIISVAHGTLPTKDCGSKAGKVISIELDPAPVGDCTFPKGKNVTAIVTVEIDEVTSTMSVELQGHVVIWVDFKLPDTNACDQGITCPTTSGTQYKFKTTINVSKDYPSIRVPIRMQFIDDKKQDAICFMFEGQIC